MSHLNKDDEDDNDNDNDNDNDDDAAMIQIERVGVRTGGRASERANASTYNKSI